MKRDDTVGGAVTRLFTKAKACLELRLSLSTLNRRIADGEVAVRREPRGRRHRVYVMLDDDSLENGDAPGMGESALAMAQEGTRGLEELVGLLQEQLEMERECKAQLVDELKGMETTTAQERRGLWWRFW